MLGCAARSNPSAWSVSRHTAVARSFVYVASSGERRRTYAACAAGRDGLASRTEQPVEPFLAKLFVTVGERDARPLERRGEITQRDALLVLVPLDGILDAGQLGGERIASAEQFEPLGIERLARLGLNLPERLAVRIRRQHSQLRLGSPQGQLLAVERHPGGEQPVLELVLGLRQLVRDQAALARLPKAEEQLTPLAVGAVLCLMQRVELLACEEIGVSAHDRSLLGDLLLADTHCASLLRALEQILLEPRLELGRAQNL